MPIVKLTHNPDGSVRVRRPVTVKIAIGLPPSPGSNFPQRLDHFIFQRKTSKRVEKMLDGPRGPVGSGKFTAVVAWDIDEEMTKFYGEDCKDFWFVLLDEDPDVAFKTEMAWWSKTSCKCRGDGDDAMRLVQISATETEWQPRLCANSGCQELDEGKCKPSGDLYFILADFPSIGTICKLHTTSYQSIREIRSALEDLRSITGGRLMGVKAKLTVRLENSSYKDKSGKLVSGTKHIIGIELTAGDIKQLTDGLAGGLMFDLVQKRLGSRSIQVVEDLDNERADDISGEFYPQDTLRPDVDEPSDEEIARTEGARTSAKATTIEQVISPAKTQLAPATAKPQKPPIILDMDAITDDDLPPEMFSEDGENADPTPIGGGRKAQHFYAAWSRRKRHPDTVRKYLKEIHQVDRSFDIRCDRFDEALQWASNPLPEEPAEPMSDMERKCRETFAALNLNLIEQMETITFNKGDWNGVWADLTVIADKGAE